MHQDPAAQFFFAPLRSLLSLIHILRGKNIFDPRDVSYAVVETNGSLSAALRPEKETATLADLRLKVEHSHATIPFVLDGQILEDNLQWCGKDRSWLERTAQANTCLLYTSQFNAVAVALKS